MQNHQRSDNMTVKELREYLEYLESQGKGDYSIYGVDSRAEILVFNSTKEVDI